MKPGKRSERTQLDDDTTAKRMRAENAQKDYIRALEQLAGKEFQGMSQADKDKALLKAAKAGDAAKCGTLASVGADVNCLDWYLKEDTLLHCAAKQGSEAACRVLIEHGADVNNAFILSDTKSDSICEYNITFLLYSQHSVCKSTAVPIS